MNPHTSLRSAVLTASLALGTAAHAQVIADFSADFPVPTGGSMQPFEGTESPATGWNYLWNPDGVIGVASGYQSLLPNTIPTWPGFGGASSMFTNVGNVAFNSTAQGNFRFGRISVDSIHAAGSTPGTGDYRAIVAYTLQEGEAGGIRIANSSLAKLVATASNGVDLDIYVNDTLISWFSKDGFNSMTAADFDGIVGNLSVGDTVHVTLGRNVDPNNDSSVIDFQLVTGPLFNYENWAADHLVVEGENGDDDKDGIINLVEYALGLDPQSGDPSPGTFAGNLLSFTKGPEARAAQDVTYKIQTSTTLEAGSWTDAAATETAEGISYQLPPNEPGGKLFGRLQVTKP
jgi:hypothetical protein